MPGARLFENVVRDRGGVAAGKCAVGHILDLFDHLLQAVVAAGLQDGSGDGNGPDAGGKELVTVEVVRAACERNAHAIERRRKGMGIVESAYSAAQVRLRPILMTVLTMIFGMLPLMFSSGAGANGNSSLGTGVVGGMLIGTLALLFVVPVFYIIFEYLQEKVRPPMEEEADMQVLLEKQKSEAERAKD